MDAAGEADGSTLGTAPPPAVTFAGFTVDFAGRTLVDGAGRDIVLRRAEFELLLAFVRSPGRVLSRDTLLDALAGRRAEPFDRSIDVHVGRLRRQIEPEPAKPRLIITVPGIGYKFAAKPIPVSSKSEPAVPGQDGHPPPRRSPAERRQVSVLRCALGGFTALAGRLDPEDLQGVIARYHEACAEVVRRHGGLLGHRSGDDVTAYFGYPEASEHAAEGAVRCGLALIDAVACQKDRAGTPLAVRVAIATGSVLVTEVATPPGNPELLGEAPALAARLLAADTPRAGVVIAGATRRLVGRMFDTRPLPVERGARGADPAGFSVLGEIRTASRFEALRGGALTPLVGRAEELGLLARRWGQAKAGTGRLLLIGGEAGIGKSRLVAELRTLLAGGAHTALTYSCSPHHRDSAFDPILRHLECAAGFARDDSAAARQAKLEALLAPSRANAEAVTLVADLLSLPAGDDATKLGLSPRQRRDRVTAALTAQAAHLAQPGPLLILFEDVHWIDPSSQEVLDALIARIADLPLLLVITHRPEFAPPWASLAAASTLVLTRLDEAEAARIVAGVTDGAVAGDAVRQIVARAEGVPLYLEELAKAAAEDKGGTVPASLQDSLMARLDRLPAAKRVAQLGAVIGRRFSCELLAAVADETAEELARALDALVSSGLAARHSAGTEASYTFKHALVHDSAYQSLPKCQRIELHGRIVDALIAEQPDSEATRPDLLAWHCERADLTERAAKYYARAGRQSEMRGSYAEAHEQYDHALRLIATLPAGPARDHLELGTLLPLASMIEFHKGWACSERGRISQRSMEVWERLGCPPAFARVAQGWWMYHHFRSDTGRARDLARHVLHRAVTERDNLGRVIGHLLIGRTATFRGELANGRRHLDQVVKFGESIPYDPCPFSSPDDPQSYAWTPWPIAHDYLALITSWLGYPDQAVAHMATAVREGTQWSKPAAGPTFSWSHLRLLSFISDPSELAEPVNELRLQARDLGLDLIAASATVLHGYVVARTGDPAAGTAIIRDGLAAYQATESVLLRCYFESLLAEALSLQGEPEEALSILAGALEATERSGERWYAAELHRRSGDAHVQRGRRVEAASCFGRAIDVARSQSAKLWELRAAVSFGRLLRDQGKGTQANALLAPVYGWFTEGFNTEPLRAARTLLGTLIGREDVGCGISGRRRRPGRNLQP